MRLSDINNKEISITLTDFELAKPEDNTPEKLAERARQYKQESERPPTNPNTGEPYFETRDDAWSGEYVAGEVKPIPNSAFDMTLTSTCDKDWIYHANGEIWGRCVLRPLTESSNSI